MNYKLLKSLYYQDIKEYEKIYADRFGSPSSVRFNFSIHENTAFAVMTPELMLLSERIFKKNAQIMKLSEALPPENMNQLVGHLLVEELRLSNEIEGVHSTRKELDAAFAEVKKNKRAKRYEGLIKKYNMLLNDEKIPLKTCADVRNLYNEFILDEVLREDKDNAPDGDIFRRGNVEVTSSTQKIIHRGVTPETNIILLMTAALDMLNDDNIPVLVRISVFHYMFGYIHPFYDGNGRMNRFITSYMLSKELDIITAISLSYTIKKDKNRYYKPFDYTNSEKNRGELTGFITTFFEILDEAETDIIASLNEKLNKYNFFKEQLSAYAPLQHNEILEKLLISTLFGCKGLSIVEISEQTEIGTQTVRNAVKALTAETGIIRIEKASNALIYDLDLDKLAEGVS